MAEYLLDSSAWIEYLKGTEEGSYVRGLVEENLAATCTLSLAEVDSKFNAEKKESKQATTFMQQETTILPVLPSVAARSGTFRNEQRKTKRSFSLIDAMLYLTAKENRLLFVTKDKDFQGLEGVEIL